MAQHPKRERVDERIVLVGGVEYEFTADIGYAQGVAVVGEARNSALEHPGGIGVVNFAHPKLVHNRDRARAHGNNVAHDPANAGGCALEWLNITGTVVGLDFERHGPAIANVDDTCVLADSDELM